MTENDRVYRRLGVSHDVTLGESFYNDRLAPHGAAARRQGHRRGEPGRARRLLQEARRHGRDAARDRAQVGRRLQLRHHRRRRHALSRRALESGAHHHPHRRAAAALLPPVVRHLAPARRHLQPRARLVRPDAAARGHHLDARRQASSTSRRCSTRRRQRALDVATEASPELPRERAARDRARRRHRRRQVQRPVEGSADAGDLHLGQGAVADGEFGPYLQYAYARIQSILRKAKARRRRAGRAGGARAVGARRCSPSSTITARRSKRWRRRRGRICCATTSTISAGAFSTFYGGAPGAQGRARACARRACSCAR